MSHSNFSSSTKVLQAFGDSPSIKSLCKVYGDRLAGLTQMEKYQLSTAIGVTLWSASQDIEDPSPFELPDEDIEECVLGSNLPEVSPNVWQAIQFLKSEDLDNLAAIYSAIAEYAKEDDRLHKD